MYGSSIDQYAQRFHVVPTMQIAHPQWSEFHEHHYRRRKLQHPLPQSFYAYQYAKKLINPKSIADTFVKFPQVLVNVPVTNKEVALADSAIIKAQRESELELGVSGRLLVRASGTEELVRVMAEAETIQQAEKVVASIVSVIRARYGKELH